MTILIFGADGQLGREFSTRAAQSRIPLRLISFSEADIADENAVRNLIASAPASLVVNAAAYTQVDRAEAEADEAFRTNAVGPGVLAGVCAKAKLPLVHISTDYVFDGTKPTAYTEEDTVAPLGVYGRSKAAGEAAVRERLADHIILRTSWLYGIHGMNFLKTMMKLARERNELRVVADQIGCPTGTADIVDAILTIAPRLLSHEPVWGAYHLTGTGATTWHGFALEIVDAQAKVTGRRPSVIPITTAEYPTAARRPANCELDSSRFAATFGFRAAGWRERTRDVVTALLSAERQVGS
jgi:dTDP-4-dehydrorhamnose reductase